ncbi:MAG TPA: C40 family peptidase [Burkholderiaceae bacterium]|nr:C40 family peptidase [Burkholderiaceae bacterium]
MSIKTWILCCCALLLAACGSVPQREHPPSYSERPPASGKGSEVVLYALGLIDTGYRFGGKNPEAGLDCSGMVAYIYREALGITVSGSAADIAQRGRSIAREALRPGDLVFFNTLNRPFSHVGIYIGDGRFINAPSTNGRVRIDRLDNRYYAQRFEAARSYFD